MKGAELRTARARFIAARAPGQSWHQALSSAGLPLRRAAAYNLERRFRDHGAAARDDDRHGHPAKLRDQARHWLLTTCQDHPAYPAHQLQQLLRDDCRLAVSTAQIRRVRRAIGLRYQSPKKS